jgi:hypothetical protein
MASLLNIYKKAAYITGVGCGVFAGYYGSYNMTDYMGANGYSDNMITLGTLAAKEVGYYSGNVISHYLLNFLCYKDSADRNFDIKRITKSNLTCMGIGTIFKPLTHRILLCTDMQPEAAFLWSYIPIGIGGFTLKVFMDYKASKKRKATLEDIVVSNNMTSIPVVETIPCSNYL